MEREIQLKSASIKYWTESHPLEKSNHFDEKKFKCKINQTCHMIPQRITMEFNLHKDVNSYGLLGVDFKPREDSDTLEITIAYVKENHTLYSSNLVKYDTYMYCGLPEEYLTTVFNKIQQYVENHAFSGGELILPFAANSEVRSSPRFFEILIEMLMEVLATNIEHGENASDNYDDVIQNIFLKSEFFKNQG